MNQATKQLSKLFTELVLAGMASYSPAAETIKIALAGPKTGPVAQYGDMQFIGAQMAIDMINKAGGVDGMLLEGVVYDDACDPKQAVAVANKVVNDEIKYVVGHLCSSSTQPASDIYEDEGILMITAASTSPDITTSDGVRLHVEIDGPADGPPVLVLHGITGCTATWDWLVPIVAANRGKVMLAEELGTSAFDFD